MKKITITLTPTELRELRIAANVNVDSYEANEEENSKVLVIARRVYQMLLDAEKGAKS